MDITFRYRENHSNPEERGTILRLGERFSLFAEKNDGETQKGKYRVGHANYTFQNGLNKIKVQRRLYYEGEKPCPVEIEIAFSPLQTKNETEEQKRERNSKLIQLLDTFTEEFPELMVHAA